MANPYQGTVELIKNTFYTENVTDEVYYKDYTSHISNSALGLINYAQNGGLQKFLDGFSSKKTTSLELGSLVHKMTLEKDLYTISPVDKPSGKIGDIIEVVHRLQQEGVPYDKAILDACIECDYYNGNPGEKRIEDIKTKGAEYLNFLRTNDGSAVVMTAALKYKLNACCTSINNNKKVYNSLFPKGQECYREFPIFGNALVSLEETDEELGFVEKKQLVVPIKCKIDFFSIDRINNEVNLIDLKTTSKPIQTFMGYYSNVYNGKTFTPTYVLGSFYLYCYYRQMAMYSDMLMRCLIDNKMIDESFKLNVKMAVVETCEPYMSELITVNDYILKEGKKEYSSLLKMYAYHNINGFDKVVLLNELEDDFQREERNLC